MLPYRLKISIYYALVSFASLIEAQTSPAVCMDSFGWAYNSKGQTPCLVVAYLLSRCANGQWNIPALQPGQSYSPPDAGAVNPCQCSTVSYQLISACAECQGQQINAWSTWRSNCTDSLVSIATFPVDIPPATAVPAWAYLDISGTDHFDATAAQALGDQPESTQDGATSISISSTSSTLVTSSTSAPPVLSTEIPSPSPKPTASTPHRSNDVAVIIGSSVGGAVGLFLLIAIAVYLWRRDTLLYQTKKNQVVGNPNGGPYKGQPEPISNDMTAVGFASNGNTPLNNHSLHATTVSPPGTFAGHAPPHSPYSPPPAVHTPAPNYAAYGGVYTPAPPTMNGSPQVSQYPVPAHPFSIGYQSATDLTPGSATVSSYEHDRSPSHPSRYNGAPEL